MHLKSWHAFHFLTAFSYHMQYSWINLDYGQIEDLSNAAGGVCTDVLCTRSTHSQLMEMNVITLWNMIIVKL